MSVNLLEEGSSLQLDFGKLTKVVACGQDVIPAVVQNAETGDVLMVGYVNQLALETARECGLATFWSTSRNELWIKGSTSGDTLKIVEIRVNCEQNSVLYRAIPQGAGVCHTRDAEGNHRSSCYYRKLESNGTLSFVEGPTE
ncbi:MAG: phosphoribosyl-AMP cyclohydrolase [Verrucomicrobiota bacterium]